MVVFIISESEDYFLNELVNVSIHLVSEYVGKLSIAVSNFMFYLSYSPKLVRTYIYDAENSQYFVTDYETSCVFIFLLIN